MLALVLVMPSWRLHEAHQHCTWPQSNLDGVTASSRISELSLRFLYAHRDQPSRFIVLFSNSSRVTHFVLPLHPLWRVALT